MHISNVNLVYLHYYNLNLSVWEVRQRYTGVTWGEQLGDLVVTSQGAGKSAPADGPVSRRDAAAPIFTMHFAKRWNIHSWFDAV